MSGVKFEPLRSLARNAQRRNMGMQCDPSWVLDVFAERDSLSQRCRDLEEQAKNAWHAAHSESMDWAKEYERRREAQAERDTLRAEVERLQDSLGRHAQQIAALVADPNGWQAGYDKGRHDGTKFRLSELEQERSENAELRRIVSECARAAGAMVAVDCSLKFMAGVPAEIKARCRSSPSSS